MENVVNGNSDVLYDGRDYSIETIPAEYKDFAFGKDAKKNDCTDLTFSHNTYSMARIMDCGYTKSDSVQLRLLANGEGTEDVELGWFRANEMSHRAWENRPSRLWTRVYLPPK